MGEKIDVLRMNASEDPSRPTGLVRRGAIPVALAALAVALGLLVWKLASVLLLLFAAALFGAALHHAGAFLHRRTRLPRTAGVITITLLVLGAIVAFGWFMGASFAGQLDDLADRIPQALDSVRAWLLQQPLLRPLGRELEALQSGAESSVGTADRFLDAFRVTLGTLSTVVVVVVLAVYLALDSERYRDGLVRLTPPAWRERARDLLEAWGEALSWWLAGRLLSMVVVGILIWIGLLAAGVPLPATLALLAAVLSFVPFLGPIFSTIPAALVALTVSVQTVAWTLGIFLAAQLLESYVITPQIQERTVSVPPVILVASQLVMGSLLGLAGVLFATPLVVAAGVTLQVVYLEGMLGEDVRLWGSHGE